MEKVLQQILAELKELRQGQEALRADVTGLQEGQARLEKGLKRLENGQAAIRKEIKAVWQDIKKLDDRLEKQEKTTRALLP